MSRPSSLSRPRSLSASGKKRDHSVGIGIAEEEEEPLPDKSHLRFQMPRDSREVRELFISGALAGAMTQNHSCSS